MGGHALSTVGRQVRMSAQKPWLRRRGYELGAGVTKGVMFANGTANNRSLLA